MLLIMKELLMITPISLVGETTSTAEYFMPSLLRPILPTELEVHCLSSSSVFLIAIWFSSGFICSCVFDCYLVYQIKGLQLCLLLLLTVQFCLVIRFTVHACSKRVCVCLCM